MERAKEGSLFKIIVLGGKTFELRYGYYADYERESEYGEPIPLYPDFQKNPMYTDDGYPFVTQMQALCPYGKSRFADGCCVDCSYYAHGEELLGICRCEKNRSVPPKNAFESVHSEETL